MSQKYLIIGIRYSLIVNNPSMWRVGRNITFNDYMDMVLSPTRLYIRELLFKINCLPSLVNLNNNIPENIHFKVLIMTTDQLPEKNKKNLEKMTEKYPFIEISYNSVNTADVNEIFSKTIQGFVKPGAIYASTRLDDDDALSVEWLEKIILYLKPRFNNMVISLAGGYAAIFDENGKIKEMVDYKWRFASIGLTLICRKNKKNLSIYHAGNHMITDDKYPTIIDSRGKCIFRAFHEFNDGTESFPKKNNLISSKDYKKILKNFHN